MNNKTSIAIFTNTLLSGGAEKQALLLAITLQNTFNVTLVVYFGNEVEIKSQKIVEENNIHVVYLNGTFFKKAVTFYKLLRNENTQIIFSYLLTTNLVGSFIGKLARVPVRVGGIRNAKLSKNKVAVQRFINNKLSTHTIYNNYEGINALAKLGFDTKNAIVIPNCFELNTDVRTRKENEYVNLITVGRFVQQKGYFEALKIMQRLKNENINFKYFIVGFGELETAIREEIENLNLQDVVEVLINPANLLDYYALADIYVCTSYFEGLSNTIMEALSYSLPVVATDVGDNNRLVVDGVNGYIVAECKYDLFLAPLKKLMLSPDLRNSFGKESYRIIKDTYSGSAFKENYHRFIDQAIHHLPK